MAHHNAQTSAFHALTIIQRASLIELCNALRMADKFGQDATAVQSEIQRRLSVLNK